jgi:nitroreductase/dihydropteridine reductase
MNNITDSLKWRYATQTFDTEKEIPQQDMDTILESGNLAATAYGLQPFEFILITDQSVKESLVEHAYGQEHLAQNSALITIAIRTDIDEAYITKYIEHTAAVRNIPVEGLEGFKQSMIGALTSRSQEERNHWAQKQAYIALGTMMAAASELGVDNHAAEGFVPEKFDEVLQLKEKNLQSTVLLALGYRTENPDAKEEMFKVKVRKEIADMVTRI